MIKRNFSKKTIKVLRACGNLQPGFVRLDKDIAKMLMSPPEYPAQPIIKL